MDTVENDRPVVSIGIDAAVVASHQVAIRGPGVAEDFGVRPTLAGLEELTVRLADWAPAMVVAEPTAGTWLPLLHAISNSLIQDDAAYQNWLDNRISSRQLHANIGFEQGFSFWGKRNATITNYSSGGATGPGLRRVSDHHWWIGDNTIR